jgi:hypothetical protein
MRLVVVTMAAALVASQASRAGAQGTPPPPTSESPAPPPAPPKPACPEPSSRNPTAKSMLKIAECNAAVGHVATAWRQFRVAANAAGRDLKTQQHAQERADAMVKLLPRLTVNVPTDVPLSVTIDDTNLPPEQWGVALAIDPGKHVVAAATDDGRTWDTTFDVAIRENKTIDVEQPTKAPVQQPLKDPDKITEPDKEPVKEPVKEPDKDGKGKVALEALDPVAYDHARAPKISAMRTDKAPNVDGSLDDAIWQKAPRNSSFYLETSKPFGLPSDEPTTVQVAYDARYLYIGITCAYSTPHEPVDSVPLTETSPPREFVGVYLDSEHSHSDFHVFALSPDGYRQDWEVWNNGADANFEWTGLWEGKTSKSSKGWTAEFQIPWGTVGMTSAPENGEVGINFRRSIGLASVMSWSLSPPGSPRPLPSFAGHADGIHDTSLTQIITLVPYLSGGWSQLPSYREQPPASWLRNLNGRAAPFTAYGGLYGRVQTGHGVSADFMINPDFSQVTPDAALANLDRFELFFPEVRNFFVNVASTYAFGTQRYQLFYSRRIGLRRRIFGFDEVPILYGVNASVRQGNTTVSVLEVYNDSLDGPVELGRDTSVDASHTVVARAMRVFGPSRLGLIALDQSQPFSPVAYRAFGADGVLALYRNHLVLSGWGAGSGKRELIDLLSGPIVTGHEDYHLVSGLAWQGAATFKAQEVEVNATYTDIGKDFRGDLGFFEKTGVRRSDLAGYYRPQIHSDLIRSVGIGAQMYRLVSHDDDAPIQSRLSTLVEARLLDAGSLSFSVSQVDDTVTQTFYVANHRIGIRPGTYTGKLATVAFQSAPGQKFEVGASYVDGYYFGGDQQVVTPSITAHFRQLAASLLYQHYRIVASPTAQTGDDNVVSGDRLSARLVYAVTPDLKLSGAIEANTLDPAATTQLVGNYRLDGLSSLTVVVNRSAPSIATWIHDPSNQILFKLTYGFSAP